MIALILRELRLAATGGAAVLPLVFFLLVATLFPFAVGPDGPLLARTGGGALWMAALLAALLPVDRLVAPDRDVRPFQDVLLDLGARLGLPGLVDGDGAPAYRDYADYIVRHQRTPGVGLLAGWRGPGGALAGVGAPNPAQLDRYAAHGCFWRREVPAAGRYYKMANRDYLEWAKSLGFVGATEPIVLQFYAESLQRFRLAAQGHGARQPPDRERERVARHFDPLPYWHAGLARDVARGRQDGTDAYPLCAITQRPMFMYHSWGSQNKWLRQIAARNYSYLHPDTAAANGVDDGDWIWLVAPRGRIRVQAKLHAGTAPGTIWTWNAIGKHKGAWKLAAGAPENVDGFLLNHLIDESLRDADGAARYANADPVTGQAAWFDLRVRIERDPAPRVEGHRIELAETRATARATRV